MCPLLTLCATKLAACCSTYMRLWPRPKSRLSKSTTTIKHAKSASSPERNPSSSSVMADESRKSINDLVKEWLSVDINLETRQEIIVLHDAGDIEELEKRLRNRIVFGTAGLRSKMEAGFSRLNDVTVLQASQGLASYVSKQTDNRVVIIGHDHRLNSKNFAEIAATAFLLRGFRVYYLASLLEIGDLVPTPMVPFAVDYYGASCGIMITASHNPASDNGYKVYWSNGCQIIPPHDHGIADEILLNLDPIEDAYETNKIIEKSVANGNLVYSKEEILTAYVLHINAHLLKREVNSLKFVYTPMHGVGLEVLSKVASLLGVKELITVKEQAQPDPLFSTVVFPNPEEKGALDLAITRADELGIDLVIANDPDADRFSAAVKYKGEWRQLTGNELGYLFAKYTYNTFEGPLHQLYFVNSTVSSQMISSMAESLGLGYEETLTGFKWIGNKAIDLEKEGFRVPFGFEEAIGFMFKGIHDKDGISAAAVFLQMAQEWKDQGTNAIEVLKEGFERFGYFKEYNSYYTVPNPELTETIFENIRAKGDPYPSSIGEYKITYWRDLTIGYESSTKDNIPVLPTDPSSQMITVKLSTRHRKEEIRFTMRGSGTEPKLKVYIEARAQDERTAADLAKEVWELLRKEFFQPEKTGLVEAAH